jgi:DnaJ-domain-containing protein 1
MIGQSYETTQTLDADALADPCFLEESWTLGVSAALKNRQQRLQRQAAYQQAAQQKVAKQNPSSVYDGLGSEFFVRLRQWDAQQVVPATDTYSDASAHGGADASANGDTEAAQADANWDRFNATRESRRLLNTPTEMNASLAHRLLGVTAMSSREQIRSAYRRLVVQWHPDHLAQSSEETRRQANEQMIAINLAYQLLCEDQLKKAA